MLKLEQKKVLITGGAGFLGTYLAQACLDEGATLYGIDIRKPFNPTIWTIFLEEGLDAENVKELFLRNQFDVIFHLAGGASVGDSVQYPEQDFNSLLPPTFKLIQYVKNYCPNTHFVLFSSAAVYGNPDILPVKETSPIHPLSPYGIHKALVENMLQYYSNYYGFRSSVLRIFSAFGEGLRKQLFWDVMCRYEKALTENSTDSGLQLHLFGTGNESRDFIHCTDVVQAAVLIATHEAKECYDVFNVASGNETNIKSALKYLFSKTAFCPSLLFSGTTRKGDPDKWRADISKLQGLGFECKNNLSKSLSEYCDWFMKERK